MSLPRQLKGGGSLLTQAGGTAVLIAVELVGKAQGDAAPEHTRPHTHRLGYSGMIAAGDFRTSAHDLLMASGLNADKSAALLRRVADPDEWD